MENTNKPLQEMIDEANSILPKENREVIESFDWKSIISRMSDKFNEGQIDTLITETELLLCGLVNPKNYPKELEQRMGISGSEISKIIQSFDSLIFKRIQAEIEKKLEYTNDIPLPPYKNEIVTGEKIEENKLINPIIVNNKNVDIYKNSGIEMIEEKETEEDTKKENIKKESTINNLYNSGINVVEDVSIPKEENIPQSENDKSLIDDIEHPEKLKNSILSNKLNNNSVSKTTISDHNLPKMGVQKSNNF